MARDKKATSIGGQALIEGIMMKGPRRTVIAVREPDGNILIDDLKEKNLKEKLPFLGWPVIRGAVNLIQSMITGYKALMYSAEKSGMTELEEEEDRVKLEKKLRKKAEKQAAGTGKSADEIFEALKAKADEKQESGALMGFIMALASVLGIGLAVLLFMWLPTFLFNILKSAVPADISGLRAVFEGVVKIIIFVVYLALVSLMKDIKRVFMYHGAEHKTIFCYENGDELTVENVRKNRRFHPRCGTSFMILMLIVSIVFYAIVARVFPVLTEITLLWVALRIILLPVICGLGYELIRFCGRHDNVLTRIISAPGMWLQRLTTKEPDDSMIEVAIASIEAVIPENPDEDKW